MLQTANFSGHRAKEELISMHDVSLSFSSTLLFFGSQLDLVVYC